MRNVVLAAVVAGLLLLLRYNGPHFLPAYLQAFLFFSGLTAGSLVILFTHSLSGGRWGGQLRPFLQGMAAPVWVLALMFLPLAFGVKAVYANWANPAHAAHLPNTWYLNTTFFFIRAAIYFVLWTGLEQLYRRRTLERMLSGPALAVMFLTITFASFDWIMSLEPHWYSTMFGAYTLVNFVFMAMLFAILARITAGPAGDDALHYDLGNFMLSLLLLWAYLSFGQFLIIWSADLPEENHFYLLRSAAPWKQLYASIALLHASCFLLLLFRRVKRSSLMLGIIAALLLAGRILELRWLVSPVFPGRSGLMLEIAAYLAFAVVWVASYQAAAARYRGAY